MPRTKGDNPILLFVEDPNDQWAMECLDNRKPCKIGLREIGKLRRMRKKARVTDTIIAANKLLRKQLDDMKNYKEGSELAAKELLGERIANLAATGMSKQAIQSTLRISAPLMNQHQEMYDWGKHNGQAMVAAKYFATANDPHHPAYGQVSRKWMESQVEGWKEVKRIETASVAAEQSTIDVGQLSMEERSVLRLLLDKADVPQLEQSMVAEVPADD